MSDGLIHWGGRGGTKPPYRPMCGAINTASGVVTGTTDQADVTCPACREWMAAIQDLQKEVAAMRSRSWITVPLTATTATAGETIYPGEAVFIDRDGLVRLTDREEAAKRKAREDDHEARQPAPLVARRVDNGGD